MDDAFLFNFDRDKNPEKYVVQLETTIVLGEVVKYCEQSKPREQKQLEEKGKKKSANDAFWEERKRLRCRKFLIMRRGSRKYCQIKAELKRKHPKAGGRRVYSECHEGKVFSVTR